MLKKNTILLMVLFVTSSCGLYEDYRDEKTRRARLATYYAFDKSSGLSCEERIRSLIQSGNQCRLDVNPLDKERNLRNAAPFLFFLADYLNKDYASAIDYFREYEINQSDPSVSAVTGGPHEAITSLYIICLILNGNNDDCAEILNRLEEHDTYNEETLKQQFLYNMNSTKCNEKDKVEESQKITLFFEKYRAEIDKRKLNLQKKDE